MNITFVSDSIYPYNKGGKEKRLYELSTRLAQLGHDVHIYTMKWWASPSHTLIADGVTLHALCNQYDMYSDDRRSIKEAFLFSIACLKLITVKFEILDVDHMPFFPVYSAWIVCKLRRKKFFGTWHEALSRQDWLNYMGIAGNVAAVIETVSAKLPDHISAASAHTKRLLVVNLGRTKSVSVISSGVDTKAIAAIKPAQHECDILYVGRFVKDKNVDQLVRAIAILAKTNESVRAIIIGHGVEKANLEKLLDELQVRMQIKIVGPLAEADEIYAYMKAAKVFCLPSVREGFGIVALEALACGTPVVTTNAPANAAKDLIVDDINGSLVNLSPANLATALDLWLAKPRPNGLAHSIASYDWDDIALAQIKAYTT